jgi:hypothetical protein
MPTVCTLLVPMKSKNNNDNDDDDDDNNNNTAMGSVHARGDTFLTSGLKALTETNTSRLATGHAACQENLLACHFGHACHRLVNPDIYTVIFRRSGVCVCVCVRACARVRVCACG